MTQVVCINLPILGHLATTPLLPAVLLGEYLLTES